MTYTRYDSPGRVIGQSQRPDNTQHLHETDIQAVGGIRNRNSSERPQAYALDRAATAFD
jgi:hypothetical protein